MHNSSNCFWSQGNEGANDRSPKSTEAARLSAAVQKTSPRSSSEKIEEIRLRPKFDEHHRLNAFRQKDKYFADVNYKLEVLKFGSPPNDRISFQSVMSQCRACRCMPAKWLRSILLFFPGLNIFTTLYFLIFLFDS